MATSIPSSTVADRFYTVKNGVCNCPAGVFRRTCKHIANAADLEERERGIMERGREMTTKQEAAPEYDGEPQSRTIARLAAALAKAQSELPHLVKDSTGQVGQQKTRYASLEAVVDVMREPFNNNGLAFTQSPISAPAGFVGLKTRLLHSSGEWLEDVFELPAVGTAQGYGSALTYARRYALQALAGLAPEDDDGHAAMPQPAQGGAHQDVRGQWQTGGARPDAPASPSPEKPAEPKVPDSPEIAQFKAFLKDAARQSVSYSTVAQLLDAPFGLAGVQLNAWLAKDGPAALSRWLGDNPEMTASGLISRAADLQLVNA